MRASAFSDSAPGSTEVVAIGNMGGTGVDPNVVQAKSQALAASLLPFSDRPVQVVAIDPHPPQARRTNCDQMSRRDQVAESPRADPAVGFGRFEIKKAAAVPTYGSSDSRPRVVSVGRSCRSIWTAG